MKRLLGNKNQSEDTQDNNFNIIEKDSLASKLHLYWEPCDTVIDVNDENEINPKILEQYEYTKNFLKKFILENCKNVKIIENADDKDGDENESDGINDINTWADPGDKICLELVCLDVISKDVKLYDSWVSISLMTYYDIPSSRYKKYYKKHNKHSKYKYIDERKYYYKIEVGIKFGKSKIDFPIYTTKTDNYYGEDSLENYNDNLELSLMAFTHLLNGNYEIQKNGQVKFSAYKNPNYELILDKDGRYKTRLAKI